MFAKLSSGIIFALLASFFTSCGVVLSRYLLIRGENPLNLIFWIMLFAAIPWLVIFQKHHNELIRLSKRTILYVILLGIAGSIGISYLQTLALANTTAVNFAFLYRTVVVFTIIFAWMFLKEKITREKIFLVISILIGSYFLTTNGQSMELSKGDYYSLLMAASAAFISNILIKHSISKMDPDLSGSITSVVSAIALLVLAAGTNVLKIPQNLMLVVIGSVCWFLLIFFRNRAYQISTASFVTMIFATSPLFVAILSFIFLHETLTPIEMIGGLVIVGSTFLVQKFKI